MGALSEYLGRQMSFDQVTSERKLQLQALSGQRGGRDVLVYAADINKAAQNAPIAVDYSDLAPIVDQLANLHGQAIDVVIETPGGSGEVAEDIVRLLHQRYAEVAFIIPGWAKSAGTIMAMAGHEILMGNGSALGPIDAQLLWQGKNFSADALLEGIEKIKEETDQKGALNRAYIPILQGISPGEIQSAKNALGFARTLVTNWLTDYKFQNWTTHSTSGLPVTPRQKRARARTVARQLCNHRKWLTHGRSLKIADLEGMGLKIVNFDDDPALSDVIGRYHALLLLTFQTTLDRNIYKVIETPNTQVYRQLVAATPQGGLPIGQAMKAHFDFRCPTCGTNSRMQANLGQSQPLEPGCVAFPPDGNFTCPNCAAIHDLSAEKAQVEAQSGKSVVA